MGRAGAPLHAHLREHLRRAPPSPAGGGRRIPAAALAAVLLAGTAHVAPAIAQTLNERLARSASAPGESNRQDRMLVDADEMIYDRDANAITARGNVQIYYQGRVLQADRVIFNQATRRVFAEGRAKLTERDGSVAYAQRFDLTDDFRDGFVDSLRAETADRTTFTASRAERIGGETTVLTDGGYTACVTCLDNPAKPPTWRVKARRIIHNNSEQTVYYEDATFELWGMPIAWLPYFSTPDPSVKRKSGLLAPRYVANSALGVGVSLPVYFALAPNYDLTLTPTLLSRQGLLGAAEWRHRLMNGSYTVRASGVFQQDPDAFKLAPYGPGDRRFRGSLESTALFHINRQWRLGWDVTFLSDRWFLQDYRLSNQSLAQYYFKEAISTVHMTGQGARGYFDLRGYHFRGLSRVDLQEQQPLVAPLIDYNKTFDVPPERTAGIGGQIEIDFNFTNIQRDLAAFEAIGGRRLDRAYQLYDVCTPGPDGRYSRADCLLRGMAGNYARATAQISWKRQFVDPIGQVWTPFAFAHLNGSWLDLDTTGRATWVGACGGAPCTSELQNISQLNFFNKTDHIFRGHLTPGAGLEYRYPFIARTANASHVIEPIVQVVARPGVQRSRTLVNEDAQSLVFDDTNLFQWSKYSGYDRFEGGTRVNYAVQYTGTFDRGGYASFLLGQSVHVAGPNSYASPDAANVGLSSGLDRSRSDYVARAAFAPSGQFNFVAKGRFDAESFTMRRLDLIANANIGPIEASLLYANYEAQPEIGFDKRRQGFAAAAKVRLSENYFVNGSVIMDMSRHLYTTVDAAPVRRAPLFSVAGLGVGAGYTDECTTLAVNYTSILQDNGAGVQSRNQTITLQLQLRTLGDARVRSGLGEVRLQDGLSPGTAR